MAERVYIAIDLKSFYASVECMARGLDPLTTHLVVADAARTEKTICLAVSPSLRAYGIPGRARLFEVVQKVRELNALRLTRARKASPESRQTRTNWQRIRRLQFPTSPPVHAWRTTSPQALASTVSIFGISRPRISMSIRSMRSLSTQRIIWLYTD